MEYFRPKWFRSAVSHIDRMPALDEQKETARQLTDEDKRANVVRLAFEGDAHKFEQFCTIVHRSVPEAKGAVLRGSSVTGFRWRDGEPFDADGPGTSDLDLTLLGGEVLRYYAFDGYFLPGAHTRPVSKEDPDIAPDLIPLRERLMEMVRRPVNIQASRSWVQQLRGDILGQPYLLLFGSVES